MTEAPHLSPILPERYFHWRANEITRLEAFCDVIFGFAITLLVVSLEVPHSYAELMADMRGFLPFAACFAQLVLIWRTHYRQANDDESKDEFCGCWQSYPIWFTNDFETANNNAYLARQSLDW